MSMGNNVVTQQGQVSVGQLGYMIDMDRYADVLSMGSPTASLDLGSTMITRVTHPTLGAVLLVNTDSGEAAIIPLS